MVSNQVNSNPIIMKIECAYKLIAVNIDAVVATDITVVAGTPPSNAMTSYSHGLDLSVKGCEFFDAQFAVAVGVKRLEQDDQLRAVASQLYCNRCCHCAYRSSSVACMYMHIQSCTYMYVHVPG